MRTVSVITCPDAADMFAAAAGSEGASVRAVDSAVRIFGGVTTSFGGACGQRSHEQPCLGSTELARCVFALLKGQHCESRHCPSIPRMATLRNQSF